MVHQGCWFLFRQYFFEFPALYLFLGKFGLKNSNLSVCLKIGAHCISKMLILIPTLVFWILNPNFLSGKFGPKKSKLSVLTEKWHTWYLGKCRFQIRTLKFQPQNFLGGKFRSKKSKVSVFPENWHAWHLDHVDFYSNISFVNFQP